MVGRACKRVRGFLREHAITAGYVLLFVYISVIGGWAYGRLDGQDERAASDRRAQCEALQVLIDRQASNLDPEVVKSLFAPLRAADPEKFDAAIGRARADLARLERVQARLACPPPQKQ